MPPTTRGGSAGHRTTTGPRSRRLLRRGIRNSVSHHPTGELSEAAFAEIVSKLEPIARHPKIDADGLCSQNLEDVLAGYRAELALKIPI
jgi:hypothetical protein